MKRLWQKHFLPYWCWKCQAITSDPTLTSAGDSGAETSPKNLNSNKKSRGDVTANSSSYTLKDLYVLHSRNTESSKPLQKFLKSTHNSSGMAYNILICSNILYYGSGGGVGFSPHTGTCDWREKQREREEEKKRVENQRSLWSGALLQLKVPLQSAVCWLPEHCTLVHRERVGQREGGIERWEMECREKGMYGWMKGIEKV